MSKITTSDFQKGMFIKFRQELHQITEFQHVNPGKGSAFIRTKLKNIKTGNSIEFTYKSGESVEEVNVYVREMQYLYKEGTNYIFMQNDNFEQFSVPEGLIGTFSNFLKENDVYQVFIYENIPLGVKFPKRVRLKVIEAQEGAKGNTVSGAKKVVTVETGYKVQVPLFIKEGETIALNPETGEYLERVNQ